MLFEYLIATKSQLWSTHTCCACWDTFKPKAALPVLFWARRLCPFRVEMFQAILTASRCTSERDRLLLSLIGSFRSQLQPLIEWVLSRTELEHSTRIPLFFTPGLPPSAALRSQRSQNNNKQPRSCCWASRILSSGHRKLEPEPLLIDNDRTGRLTVIDSAHHRRIIWHTQTHTNSFLQVCSV